MKGGPMIPGTPRRWDATGSENLDQLKISADSPSHNLTGGRWPEQARWHFCRTMVASWRWWRCPPADQGAGASWRCHETGGASVVVEASEEEEEKEEEEVEVKEEVKEEEVVASRSQEAADFIPAATSWTGLQVNFSQGSSSPCGFEIVHFPQAAFLSVVTYCYIGSFPTSPWKGHSGQVLQVSHNQGELYAIYQSFEFHFLWHQFFVCCNFAFFDCAMYCSFHIHFFLFKLSTII